MALCIMVETNILPHNLMIYCAITLWCPGDAVMILYKITFDAVLMAHTAEKLAKIVDDFMYQIANSGFPTI